MKRSLCVVVAVLCVGLSNLALMSRAGPVEDGPITSHQANGFKVGEVTDHSAIVWMRLTENPTRNEEGTLRKGHIDKKHPARPLPDDVRVEDLEGDCPGAPGQVRLRYGKSKALSNAVETKWGEVGPDTDFTHQFRLGNLEPATTYYLSAETAGPGGTPKHAPLRGRFATAPEPDAAVDVTFAVMTCQAYAHTDSPEGFRMYDAMRRLHPAFYVATGDLVYYDNDDPRATTIPLARYHWHRMYGLPTLVRFHQVVPGYFMKDDHDTLADDAYPTQGPARMHPLTFEDGQRIFREQNPVGDQLYRTLRWGRGVQVWMVEGRDFRSPNPMPDGPEKSIWGDEQKAWLKRSILQSDADWKILISPTPLVGPDRPTKKDNHANETFAHEGDEIRRWIAENVPETLFAICGDRHWQYHSVHPETGLNEFACGPASDAHAGGTPGFDPTYHKFHRVKGGFLTVDVEPKADTSTITFRHRDVDGQVVYEFQKTRAIP